MKKNSKFINGFVSVVAASLMTLSGANAATIPGAGKGTMPTFNKTLTTDVFTVRSQSWSNPEFGDMGWTHHSDWGYITAEKGQTVTITANSEVKGIHPGLTVWYRGDKDTADDNYVVDHFYIQNGDMSKVGAMTEDEPAVKIGNIVMKYVAHGYDVDQNTVNEPALKPKKDGISGRLIVSFKAPYSGTYMFTVGGFNPSSNITDHAAKNNVKVTVKIK